MPAYLAIQEVLADYSLAYSEAQVTTSDYLFRPSIHTHAK
jgi:hypothetical protein